MAAWMSNQKQMQTATGVNRKLAAPTRPSGGGSTQLASRLLGGPISPAVITSASAQATAKARGTIAARSAASMPPPAATFTVGRVSAVVPTNHFETAESSSSSSGSGGGFSGGTITAEPCTDCAEKIEAAADNTLLYLLGFLLLAGGL